MTVSSRRPGTGVIASQSSLTSTLSVLVAFRLHSQCSLRYASGSVPGLSRSLFPVVAVNFPDVAESRNVLGNPSAELRVPFGPRAGTQFKCEDSFNLAILKAQVVCRNDLHWRRNASVAWKSTHAQDPGIDSSLNTEGLSVGSASSSRVSPQRSVTVGAGVEVGAHGFMQFQFTKISWPGWDTERRVCC